LPLSLHQLVSRNDALAALGGDAQFRVLRQGEFVTFPGNVVGFLDPRSLTFQSPTTLEWKPGTKPDQPPWLLAPARAPSPKYHLLIEQESGFFYAGDAHLGCYSMDGSMGQFTLSVRLPRDAWVGFGGYPHWKVTLNHEEHRIGNADERSVRSLLDRMVGQPHGHLALTRYEEDSLDLFTNKERGWLMYLREPGDSGLYVAGANDDEDADEHFTCDCGIDLEFPRSRTLPLERAADVVASFFRSGTLPKSVSWEEQ
jgi:hypothetical protein